MTDDGDFLRRWSRRKTASKAPAAGPAADPAPAKGPQPAEPAKTPLPQEAAPLPTVESLTFESDFTAFMKPEVDPGLRQQALKTLMRDPRFNVMDGLDVYIDDYSKPDPLPDEWLGQLNQMKRLGAYVEPEAEASEEKADDERATSQKAMQEQPIAFPENEPPADTASEETPPPESGNDPS